MTRVPQSGLGLAGWAPNVPDMGVSKNGGSCRELEPRQPNKAYCGLIGAIGACLASIRLHWLPFP